MCILYMPSIVLSNTHKTGQAENKETFNAMLKQQPLPFYVEYKNRVKRYGQQTIVYKRLTPIGDTDMWNLFTSAWLKGTKNRFNVDFKLYDNYSDALFDKNSWSSCNFNDDIPPENRVGFPRDCGKSRGVGGRGIRRAQCDMKINGPCQVIRIWQTKIGLMMLIMVDQPRPRVPRVRHANRVGLVVVKTVTLK